MKTTDYLLDLLYPPTCLSCGELQLPGTQVPLCSKCHEKWEELRRSRCPICRQPRTLCGCLPPLLADLGCEGVYLVPYEQTSVAGRLLLTAKDERLPRLVRFFADQMAVTLAARGILAKSEDTYITYLPRSRSRAAVAGIDQAREFANRLGERLDLPVVKAFCRRGAPPQKELTAKERLRSARRTYRLKKGFSLPEGTTVLLVDDILTSGATMLAGAELLCSAGAKSICCITVGKSEDSIRKRKK